MFGVTTAASGSRRSTSAARASSSSSDGAALGDHHRVDDDRRLADQRERLDHRVDGLRGPQHPDLDRVDADVFGDRAHLGDDHLRRDRLDRLDPDRVLRRDRGDRGHPVHAAARERLQVRLDAGAAAGVRAGDREHCGNACPRVSIAACTSGRLRSAFQSTPGVDGAASSMGRQDQGSQEKADDGREGDARRRRLSTADESQAFEATASRTPSAKANGKPRAVRGRIARRIRPHTIRSGTPPRPRSMASALALVKGGADLHPLPSFANEDRA